MNAVDPVRKLPKLPPDSRVFNHGVLGDKVDGRSREGRFLVKCEAKLIADIGGEPTLIAAECCTAVPGTTGHFRK
jgi:hypothetical protein